MPRRRGNDHSSHRPGLQANPASSSEAQAPLRRTRSTTKDWCFTLNNPTEEEVEVYKAVLSGPAVRYAIFQREVGNLGTPHLQGYFELCRPRALNTVRQMFPRVHAEPRRGTRDQAREYCLKSETAVPGSRFEYGDFEAGGQGSRTDIKAVTKFLSDGHTPREAVIAFPLFAAQYPRFIQTYCNALCEPRHWKTKVFVFVGPTGAGKTRLAHTLWPKLYSKPPGANAGCWFDNYSSERTVLIDDFRGKDMPFEFLLQLLDRFRLQVPVKGSHVEFVPHIICITSNEHPKDWYFRDDPDKLAPMLRRIDHLYEFPISAVDRLAITSLASYGSPGGLPLLLNSELQS